MGSVNEIQVVDLARGFSIFAVWAFHFGLAHLAGPSGPVLLQFFWHRFWINGAFGVQVFFVVSGFLITRLIARQPQGLFRPSYRFFYSRRAGRILPLFFLSVLIGIAALIGLLASAGSIDFYLRNSKASFNAPFWFSLGTFSFNWYRGFLAPVQDFGLHWDILWSLSIEEQFYLFYPLLLTWLGREKSLYRVLLAFILLGPLVRLLGVVLFPQGSYWNLNSFAEFDLLAMGCLLFLATRTTERSLRKRKGACFMLCGAGAFILLTTFFTLPTALDFERRVLGPSLVGVGVFLFLLGGIHLEFFESKVFAPLALAGKLSYGGYLLHPLVLFLLCPFLAGKNEWLAFMFLAVAIVAISWLSHEFYEKPANHWVRGLALLVVKKWNARK